MVALDDCLVWAMRDSGSNFSSITTKTAQVLNLWTEDFERSFAMADGTVRKFAGMIPTVKLRLHDYLTVEIKGLRVLPGTFSQVIIGQDVLPLDNSSSLLREVGIQRDGHR